MKHQMLTIRLPSGLLDAYRDLSLDGRKLALEAMRRALQESCKSGVTAKESSVVAAPVPAEPAPVTPAEDVPENPFPDLMKEFVTDAGW